jgi:exopolyphosphatase/pppGpp-phosphohydrolase
VSLYDGLAECKAIASDRRQRCIVEAAALTEEVGWSKRDKGRRKRSFKLLHKLAPPPGWSLQDMRAVAIVARFHQGALAPLSHRMFAGIPLRSRNQLLRLAGVLRLANALAGAAPSSEVKLDTASKDGVICITVANVEAQIGIAGERMARAKYLLEATCGVSIRLRAPSEKVAKKRAGVRNSSPAPT